LQRHTLEYKKRFNLRNRFFVQIAKVLVQNLRVISLLVQTVDEAEKCVVEYKLFLALWNNHPLVSAVMERGR
jgi:hypothetical protein